MVLKANNPPPTSRASGSIAPTRETEPPVSGRAVRVGGAVLYWASSASAVAVEEMLAEELLAEELAGWSTHTVTDSPSSVGLVVQPDALALEDCAKAAGANSNAPITDRPINSNNLLTVFLPRWVSFPNAMLGTRRIPAQGRRTS
jgi:hypothetical protein